MLGITLDEKTVYALAAVAIFLLVGFPVHEFAHAWTANRLGDGTARLFGRLSLNPAVHFDPLGAAILALSALFGAASGRGFFIGWAKPTPVNPVNLRGGRTGEAWVAAAGPASNLAMAAIAGVVVRLMLATDFVSSDLTRFVANVTLYFVVINVALFIFNFIPIPPLDGSKVLFAFLDPRTVWQVRPALERWGFFIILLVFLVPIGGESLGGRVVLPLMDGLVGLQVGW